MPCVILIHLTKNGFNHEGLFYNKGKVHITIALPSVMHSGMGLRMALCACPLSKLGVYCTSPRYLEWVNTYKFRSMLRSLNYMRVY